MLFSRKKDRDFEKEIAGLKARIAELEHDLIHDELTGLNTRAFFTEKFGSYIEAIGRRLEGGSKRKEDFGFSSASVIFFDIDHFKNINDTGGHDIGDLVLKRIASTIASELRTDDIAARWGGEEFVAGLLGAQEADAADKAEDIRTKVEALSFPELPDLRVTISAGVASFENSVSLAELVKRSDQALYAAKNSGRNRVVQYSESVKLQA